MKLSKYLSFFALAIILPGFAARSQAAASYVFPAFNVGTLVGGGAGFTNNLTAYTNVPSGEYFVFRVTADYQSAPSPNDAYPDSMVMELSDGGTNIFWPASTAAAGAIGGDYTNVIAWTGMFPQLSYQGGSNLTIQFMDTYSDSFGTYYSTMSNVVVTLYPATTPSQTFAPFNVGTLTGGGPAFTNSPNVSGLPDLEYLFTRVTANYQSDTNPYDARPYSMEMEMNDGGTNVFWPASTAGVGAVDEDYTNVIAWSGMFPQVSYQGGTNLDVLFMDDYYNGFDPSYSTMGNAVVTLYPAPEPSQTFASFNVGTLASSGPGFTNSLNITNLPASEYLYVRVTADYQSGPTNLSGPSTMEMELSDGGTNIFWPASAPTVGAVNEPYTNVIAWAGIFPQTSYQGGTNLVIQFMDTNTYEFNSLYSTMSNVVVTLYPAIGVPPTPPQLGITGSRGNVVLAWTNLYAGFTLESATNLNPPVTWSAVSPAPVNVNGQFMVTNPVSNSSQEFYRLSAP